MTDSTLPNSITATTSKELSLPAWLVLICLVSFTILLTVGAVIWKNWR